MSTFPALPAHSLLPTTMTAPGPHGSPEEMRLPAGSPLPVPLSTMVGRDDEVALIRQLLLRPQVRLVTLTGPGGAGKTRLALRAALEMREAFAGRVLFVALGTVHDPADVLPEIGQVVGGAPSSEGTEGTIARIREAIADRPTLVVLDNLEQVVAAAADLSALLSACPNMALLVTSRERLRITGEHIVPVLPLAVPSRQAQTLDEIAASEAVQLFVERARAVAPGFALSEANAATIAEICRRLDGLPLAIELAAARADVLSPKALLARLERRLVLLTGGGRDQPERLRTMRQAIAWSYDLLTPAERRLFRRLSVFADGCPLEAAELIGVDDPGSGDSGEMLDVDGVLDGIVSLVEKSLLAPADGPDGERRFRMLETIREYAGERLAESGEAVAIGWRHARWVLGLAKEGHAGLRSEHQADWIRRLDAEEANIRAALAWATATAQALDVVPNDLPPVEGGAARPTEPTAGDVAALAVALAGYMGRYWEMRGQYREGRGWYRRVLALPGAEQASLTKRARASLMLGNMAGELGDLVEAEAAYQTACDLWAAADDGQGVADALNNLSILAIVRGDYDRAQQRLEESLARRRAGGLPYAVALSIGNLADLANIRGAYERAASLAREALAIRERIGDQRGVAYARHQLGEAKLGQGDDDGAAAVFAQCLPVFEAIGDRAGQAHVWRSLGLLAERTAAPDRLPRAARYYADVVTTRAQIGKRLDAMKAVLDIVVVAVRFAMETRSPSRERLTIAAQLLGAVDAAYADAQVVFHPQERARRDTAEASLRAVLGESAFRRAQRAGANDSVKRSVADALSLVSWMSGEPSEAPATVPEQGRLREVTLPIAGEPKDDAPSRPSLGVSVPATLRKLPDVALTPREREVLQHVAAGKSDREIAAELFISHRTVTTHVTAILAKLRVGSRAAAAAEAVRLGLA